MINKGDKIVDKELIEKIKNNFRNLKDYKIEYIEDNSDNGTFFTNGQCFVNQKEKKVYIYPCPADVDLYDYVIHEMIHIAYSETTSLFDCELTYKNMLIAKELEEIFVQDICKLIKGE